MKRGMIQYIEKRRKNPLFRILCSFVVFNFAFTLVLPPSQAQFIPQAFNLPSPGTMVKPSESYFPTLIKGITIDPKNPLHFEFIVDTGNSKLKGDALKEESTKIVKYFLASLTVPENDLWVNLSPYEKERIVPDGFGQTEMGRDLLAQDYILKQLTASLMFPENELGKKFWDRVKQKAQEKFGTTEIPMNTFNKVWIVPKKASIYENNGTAFIIESELEVMLEQDYMALMQNMDNRKFGLDQVQEDKAKDVSGVASAIVKEVLIPEITKEVNQGKNFANLRQVYNAMILATWYKIALKESLLGKVYVDKNKVSGIDIEDKEAKQKIYEQYLAAFKKGVYDYIKEEYDPNTQEIVPRKYFSGGFSPRVASANNAMLSDYMRDNISRGEFRQLPVTVQARVDRAMAANVADSQVYSIDITALEITPGKKDAVARALGQTPKVDLGSLAKSDFTNGGNLNALEKSLFVGDIERGLEESELVDRWDLGAPITVSTSEDIDQALGKLPQADVFDLVEGRVSIDQARRMVSAGSKLYVAHGIALLSSGEDFEIQPMSERVEHAMLSPSELSSIGRVELEQLGKYEERLRSSIERAELDMARATSNGVTGGTAIQKLERTLGQLRAQMTRVEDAFYAKADRASLAPGEQTAATILATDFQRLVSLRQSGQAGFHRNVDPVRYGPGPESAVFNWSNLAPAEQTRLKLKQEQMFRAGQIAPIILVGGEATRFGGPKTFVQVSDELGEFLGIKADNLRWLHDTFGTDVPLYLLSSEKRLPEFKVAIKERGYYGLKEDDYQWFTQGTVDTFIPTDEEIEANFKGPEVEKNKAFARVLREANPDGIYRFQGQERKVPGGTFDAIASFIISGRFSEALARGVEYVPVVNIDNLQAILKNDGMIAHFAESGNDVGFILAEKNLTYKIQDKSGNEIINKLIVRFRDNVVSFDGVQEFSGEAENDQYRFRIDPINKTVEVTEKATGQRVETTQEVKSETGGTYVQPVDDEGRPVGAPTMREGFELRSDFDHTQAPFFNTNTVVLQLRSFLKFMDVTEEELAAMDFDQRSELVRDRLVSQIKPNFEFKNHEVDGEFPELGVVKGGKTKIPVSQVTRIILQSVALKNAQIGYYNAPRASVFAPVKEPEDKQVAAANNRTALKEYTKPRTDRAMRAAGQINNFPRARNIGDIEEVLKAGDVWHDYRFIRFEGKTFESSSDVIKQYQGALASGDFNTAFQLKGLIDGWRLEHPQFAKWKQEYAQVQAEYAAALEAQGSLSEAQSSEYTRRLQDIEERLGISQEEKRYFQGINRNASGILELPDAAIKAFNNPHRAVVVGFGQAGITATRALIEAGIPVDVLESSDVLGGMAATKIHTLHGKTKSGAIGSMNWKSRLLDWMYRSYSEQDAKAPLLQLMKEKPDMLRVIPGVRVGEHISPFLLKSIYVDNPNVAGELIFATGAATPTRLRMKGSDLPEVTTGLDVAGWLNQEKGVEINVRKALKEDDRVVIVGFSNTAADALMTYALINTIPEEGQEYTQEDLKEMQFGYKRATFVVRRGLEATKIYLKQLIEMDEGLIHRMDPEEIAKMDPVLRDRLDEELKFYFNLDFSNLEEGITADNYQQSQWWQAIADDAKAAKDEMKALAQRGQAADPEIRDRAEFADRIIKLVSLHKKYQQYLAEHNGANPKGIVVDVVFNADMPEIEGKIGADGKAHVDSVIIQQKKLDENGRVSQTEIKTLPSLPAQTAIGALGQTNKGLEMHGFAQKDGFFETEADRITVKGQTHVRVLSWAGPDAGRGDLGDTQRSVSKGINNVVIPSLKAVDDQASTRRKLISTVEMVQGRNGNGESIRVIYDDRSSRSIARLAEVENVRVNPDLRDITYDEKAPQAALDSAMLTTFSGRLEATFRQLKSKQNSLSYAQTTNAFHQALAGKGKAIADAIARQVGVSSPEMERFLTEKGFVPNGRFSELESRIVYNVERNYLAQQLGLRYKGALGSEEEALAKIDTIVRDAIDGQELLAALVTESKRDEPYVKGVLAKTLPDVSERLAKSTEAPQPTAAATAVDGAMLNQDLETLRRALKLPANQTNAAFYAGIQDRANILISAMVEWSGLTRQEVENKLTQLGMISQANGRKIIDPRILVASQRQDAVRAFINDFGDRFAPTANGNKLTGLDTIIAREVLDHPTAIQASMTAGVEKTRANRVFNTVFPQSKPQTNAAMVSAETIQSVRQNIAALDEQMRLAQGGSRELLLQRDLLIEAIALLDSPSFIEQFQTSVGAQTNHYPATIVQVKVSDRRPDQIEFVYRAIGEGKEEERDETSGRTYNAFYSLATNSVDTAMTSEQTTLPIFRLNDTAEIPGFGVGVVVQNLPPGTSYGNTRTAIKVERADGVSKIVEVDSTIKKLASGLRGDQGSLAEKKYGGINLNPALLDLQIKRDENGIPLPVSEQPIQQINIEGIMPVIINITPVANLPMMLGIGPKSDQNRTTDLSYNLSSLPAAKEEKFVTAE